MELHVHSGPLPPEARLLLVDSGLPVADLAQAPIEFLLAREAGQVIGVVGLEAYGEGALLRSMAVTPSRRSAGIGERLLWALEGRARERGIHQLVLLTETAERFFLRHGYRPSEREAVPAALRDSAEFRALCPASARCMVKTLNALPA